MVTASELKAGMALRIDHPIYKVIEVESRAGTAKKGGNVSAVLPNVHIRRLSNQHFRPLERSSEIPKQTKIDVGKALPTDAVEDLYEAVVTTRA
jgi:hypothetical protein